MAAGKKNGGRTLILLALVLIVGLAAAFFLLRDRLLPGGEETDDTGETETEGSVEMFPATDIIDIYVLQQPLERGQVIEEGHLIPVSYPKDRFMEGLFVTNPGDAVGKRALFDLEAGLPVTYSMISGSTEGSYASFQIPKGYVAVTIPIDDELGIAAVAYTLRAGDHVNVISSMLFVDMNQENQSILPDLITPVYSPAAQDVVTTGDGEEGGGEQLPAYFIPLTAQVDAPLGLAPWVGSTVALDGVFTVNGEEVQAYTVPSEAQRPRLVSQTIIQDAIVLWVGAYPLEDPKALPVVNEENAAQDAVAADPNAEVVEADEPEIPRVVTLVVSPQDAVTLNYLMLQKVQLSLALRAAGDDDRIDTESVTLQFIMQQYNIPLPTPLEYGLEPRIDSLNFYEEVPVYITP
ncbi:MAG: SAF domain-containing protein [Anaerolineae bacterium]|jgi:pilus assembly protein CpaB|nr:SAF domain-containing protein [Anaerolineae bacterium]